MLKIDEISREDSCLNKANEMERIFVLLARDITAPNTIRFWCNERIRLGKNKITDKQIQEAFECAYWMDVERKG